MDAKSGLGQLVRHCVEAFLPEAKSAALWEASTFMSVAYREERARKMLGELSAWTVCSGSPKQFVDTLPGVAGTLRREAAWLVLRMVKTHLYVAAAQGRNLEDLDALVCESALLAGLAVGLPELEQVATRRGGARSLLERAWPGGQEEALARVEGELEARVGHLENLPFASAMVGAFEFLTLAASVDLAAAWYDDARIHREELEVLRQRRADRAAAVLGLLRLTARADGAITDDEDRVLAAAREVEPTVEPEALRQAVASLSVDALPEVLPSAEERHGLLLSTLAVAAADGRLSPGEERLCRHVAALLEIDEPTVDRMVSRALSLPSG